MSIGTFTQLFCSVIEYEMRWLPRPDFVSVGQARHVDRGCMFVCWCWKDTHTHTAEGEIMGWTVLCLTTLSPSHVEPVLKSHTHTHLTVRLWDVRPFAPADRQLKVFHGHKHGFEKVSAHSKMVSVVVRFHSVSRKSRPVSTLNCPISQFRDNDCMFLVAYPWVSLGREVCVLSVRGSVNLSHQSHSSCTQGTATTKWNVNEGVQYLNHFTFAQNSLLVTGSWSLLISLHGWASAIAKSVPSVTGY